MGGSARSVLAHQGLAALGDLLHCCPARVASDKEATKEAANILMENSKKNKVNQDFSARLLGDHLCLSLSVLFLALIL